MTGRDSMPVRRALATIGFLAAAAVAGACEPDRVPPTPPITPGTSATPRQVNVIMRDYLYDPGVVDLVPGETVRLNVVNGGLVTHELVIGPQAVQDAWAAAELPASSPPPGPTPLVTVAAGLEGLRVVVGSGQTVTVTYTVPVGGRPLLLGCHIADHYERGMSGLVRLVGPGGSILPAPAGPPSPAGPADSAGPPASAGSAVSSAPAGPPASGAPAASGAPTASAAPTAPGVQPIP